MTDQKPQGAADELPDADAFPIQLAVLYKHWITADSVSYHLRRSMQAADDNPEKMPEELKALGQMQSTFSTLSVYYGLLWVVVEGYREIGLADKRIDALLEQEGMADALRRFRNAVFHYQNAPFGPKLMEFLTAKGSETWVKELNTAFEQFFIKSLNIKGMVNELQKLG